MDESKFQVFETEHWKVIVREEQRYLGRSVVVLKRPCGDVADLSRVEITDLFEVMRKVQSALKAAFGTTMFNWACNMNDAYQNMPPNPQMHWHVIPRYDHSVTFAGELFEDKNFGHHHLKGGEGDRIVSDELRGNIATELRNLLQ